MKTKHLRIIVASAGLGCLAPLSVPAQPVITAQPTNQFLSASGLATFSVSLIWNAPFTYQWLFNGTPITGATSRTLTLTNPQPAQWGYYSVIVSSASGSVTSQVAELKVFVPALHSLRGIQAQPGGSMSLSFAGETTAAFGPYYDLYPLETSSNLFDWAALATVQRTNAALDILRFVDTNAPQFSQRFYRTPTNQLATPDPQPTGPYAVGTFSMLMIDSSRTNAAGGTNYQFMTSFWYPTVSEAGVLPSVYVERQVALGTSLYNLTANGGGNFSSQVAAFFSHSLSNAPVATNSTKYPVVLYSPGYFSHRRDNTDKVEELASWGYVVVGLDNRETLVSVFPSGTVVYGQGQQSDINSDAVMVARIEEWLLDQKFVLDELESLNASDPRLAGRLDLDRIGAFGWSLGGATAAQLCLREPRCKAGVGFDGTFWETNLLTQTLNVPYLFFCEDDTPQNESPPNDDRLPVFNHMVTNAYWVKLASTVHGSFADPGLIDDSASLQAVWGTPVSGQFLPPARGSQVVRAYLLSFFNKFLKDEDNHLLDGPSPAYPEVMQFLTVSGTSGSPKYSSAALVQGTNGNFYGTTAYGGANGEGTVFQVTTNGVLTTLVSFDGTNGSHPAAGLVQGSDGNFYGTTQYGGTNGNNGTVFQMTPAGVLTTLVSFNGTNGGLPFAGLVQGSDGNFYGTTTRGGAYNLGTVFQMTPTGVLTPLVSFNGTNGNAPFAALVQGTNGNFYGTTAGGGANGAGTVFQVTPAGALTTQVAFSGGNGRFPSAGLIEGTNGLFYGTTEYGGYLGVNGGRGFGTVFRVTSAGALTTLVSLQGVNGSFCISGLVQGSDGNFYGTTAGGGPGGGGTVFKMTSAGLLTTLVSLNGANGNSPQAPLVQGSDGNFYGTTTYGGPNGGGTAFQMTPAGMLTTLVAFGN